MCCSNSLTASVPAAAGSPVVCDDVILTAATRPFSLGSVTHKCATPVVPLPLPCSIAATTVLL